MTAFEGRFSFFTLRELNSWEMGIMKSGQCLVVPMEIALRANGSEGCHSKTSKADQSRNATDAIALDWFSVFIATRCQQPRRIVA
jgi:hypothetical protein